MVKKGIDWSNMSRKIRFFFIFILMNMIVLNVLSISSKSSGQNENHTGQYVGANEENIPTKYNFTDNIAFQINSTSNVSFDITIDEGLENRFLGINASNTEQLNLSIQLREKFAIAPQAKMKYRNTQKNSDSNGNSGNQNPNSPPNPSIETEYNTNYTYNTYFIININGSFDSLTFYNQINENYGFSNKKNLSWVLFDNNTQEWNMLDTKLDSTSNISNNPQPSQTTNETSGIEILSTTLNSSDVINSQFILTIIEFSPVPTVTASDSEEPSDTYIKWFLIFGITLVAIFGLLMTRNEFRSYLKTRYIHIDKGAHRLNLEQVLENENREKIINHILSDPGIHFNELERQVDISGGTLAWHLDILVTYKIIRKQRVGQYLVYYPYFDKNPISNLDLKLQKSKTTLEILQLINDNPGMYQNQIAKRMDLNHKTVKYHLDKLLEANIIKFEKKGRRKVFYQDQVKLD
jgi:predicted transcriptional regulator